MPSGYLGFYTYDFMVSYAPEIWWGPGSATYFVDMLRDAMIRRCNGRVLIPDDPVMSISRGLYKIALQQANRKKA